MDPIDRFNESYEIKPGSLDTPCWEWKKYVNEKGYGILRVGKKMVRAHRFSYEYFIGPLAAGHVVHHKCENPSCVNPSHLESTSKRKHDTEAPIPERRCPHCHEVIIPARRTQE
jgi:hypothetical protein